jgi:hypothetical protein
MDFQDYIKQISESIPKLKDQIQTEEATKNAFIMPFIQALGYNVFNPLEVVPEYTCDIGTKKGEKVDYAIMKDSDPIILIECKHWQQNLDLHDNQLLRYFAVSKAKFGVLTNGIVYRFYTDLIEKNKMDETPFLEVDMTNLKDAQIAELKKFHKSYFDADTISTTASTLKYTKEIKEIIKKEIANPSEALVRIFAKPVYNGVLTAKMIDYFSELVKKSFATHINDILNERLQNAISKDEAEEDKKEETVSSEPQADSPQIVTTDEEMEGFYTIRAMLAETVDPQRIQFKDTMNYFAINLDKTTQPICRLFYNRSKKYIALIDDNKKETKYQVESNLDLYQFKNQLIERVTFLSGE